MPRLKFTARTIDSLRSADDQQVDYWDQDHPGFGLRVAAGGRKTWIVMYRHKGRLRRESLGTYPALSLADARDEALQTVARVAKGEDPARDRRAAKAPARDTVAALAEDYMAKHARKFKRSADEDQRILNVYVLPSWKHRSVKELTRRDVRALVEGVADRGAPIMANRVLGVVRKMLNFAIDHDWLDANPAARVAKPSPEVSRDRVLTDEELRRLWRLLGRFPTTAERPAPGRKGATGDDDDPIFPFSPVMAALLKMRILTAQRGGEVGHMRWQDLDLESGWWTIPGIHTKNGEAHRVFLVKEAVALIKEQQKDDPSESVFAGSGDTVLDRMKKVPAAVARLLKFEFRGHDLRRTAATRMAGAGVPREHISHVLNHVEGGPRATRVYDRHSYDREKRLALSTWARTLLRIVDQSAEDSSSVTAITRRRRAAS
jgi:integrase